MKVKIDGELCSGHGRCATLARSFYVLDDNGYNAQRGQTLDVPADMTAAAKMGAGRCPERAITIIEE